MSLPHGRRCRPLRSHSDNQYVHLTQERQGVVRPKLVRSKSYPSGDILPISPPLLMESPRAPSPASRLDRSRHSRRDSETDYEGADGVGEG
jgi:hypothetical protein